MFVSPMNFEPTVRPHREHYFLLTMATTPSILFILKGTNLVHLPVFFICIENLNEVEFLDFRTCHRGTSWSLLTLESHDWDLTNPF